MVRHAALAWNLGGRAIWIEPQYMDPLDCSHAMHVVEGPVTETEDAVFVGDWEVRGADDIGDVSNSQFEWYQGISGTPEDEKSRLEKSIPELQEIAR